MINIDFDYQLIITLGTLLASGIAIIFSSYNFYQSIHKPRADLWIDEDDKPIVIVYINNPGQRQIALTKFKYMINGKDSDIREGTHADPTNPGSTYLTWFVDKKEFPYILNGGNSDFRIIQANTLASTLSYKGYSDKISLSAYFETAQKKKIETKSVVFDIDKYDIYKK